MGRPKKQPKWINGVECWECMRCREYLPRDKMGIRRASPNGLNCYCLECLSVRRKEQWRKDIEHSRALSRASSARDLEKNPNRMKGYYAANRAELLTRDRERYPDRAEKNRLRCSAYSKANRERLNEARRRRNRENREVYLARKKINTAVYRGHVVKPTHCEDCGVETPKEKLHGHHPDYSKPMDVEWLCVGCHAKRHRINLQAPHTNPHQPE